MLAQRRSWAKLRGIGSTGLAHRRPCVAWTAYTNEISAVRRQLFLRMDDNYFSGSATTITPHRRQLLLDTARDAECRRQPL